jgi:hypothetical protein
MFYAPETVWSKLLTARRVFFVSGPNISENILFVSCTLEAGFITKLVTIVVSNVLV